MIRLWIHGKVTVVEVIVNSLVVSSVLVYAFRDEVRPAWLIALGSMGLLLIVDATFLLLSERQYVHGDIWGRRSSYDRRERFARTLVIPTLRVAVRLVFAGLFVRYLLDDSVQWPYRNSFEGNFLFPLDVLHFLLLPLLFPGMVPARFARPILRLIAWVALFEVAGLIGSSKPSSLWTALFLLLLLLQLPLGLILTLRERRLVQPHLTEAVFSPVHFLRLASWLVLSLGLVSWLALNSGSVTTAVISEHVAVVICFLVAPRPLLELIPDRDRPIGPPASRPLDPYSRRAMEIQDVLKED